MTTAIDREQEMLADKIVDQFIRLGVSTDDDPCSGLMASSVSLVTEIPLVKIYDDHASGIYDARAVLAKLEASEHEDFETVWQTIKDCIA